MDFDLPALGSALQEGFGDINLIGCTSGREIKPLGYLSASLNGVSLASPDLDAATQLMALEPFDSAAAGNALGPLRDAWSLATACPPAPCAGG